MAGFAVEGSFRRLTLRETTASCAASGGRASAETENANRERAHDESHGNPLLADGEGWDRTGLPPRPVLGLWVPVLGHLWPRTQVPPELSPQVPPRQRLPTRKSARVHQMSPSPMKNRNLPSAVTSGQSGSPTGAVT